KPEEQAEIGTVVIVMPVIAVMMVIRARGSGGDEHDAHCDREPRQRTASRTRRDGLVIHVVHLRSRVRIPTDFGGGGGNRTRVRMVSGQRVYVRSFRSISGGPVAETRRSAHLDRRNSRPRLRSVSGRGPAF